MMKWNLALLMFLVGLFANASEPQVYNYNDPLVQISNFKPEALLHWKVGDSADYEISAAFGKIGTLHKEITNTEGNGYWMTEKTDAMGQNDVSEALIDRDTGKVLKFIHNGKEESYPDDKPEIISQDYTSVTVPAGTFKAMHVVGKTKQVSHFEIWVDMRDVVIDGAVKQVMTAQIGDITMELTQQHRAQ